MSGICGIAAWRGLAREEIAGIVDGIRFRGPDGVRSWEAGACALGHALLDTGDNASRGDQPLGLAEGCWITADARLDQRATLATRLVDAGRRVDRDAGDASLILHAYHAWGEECVTRLRGDFAFAIWDARRERLFCARDHFGIRPFFYAALADRFVFSNTFAAVRSHAGISSRLDEGAIADFLLFERATDPSATGLADVRRLPPAHRLVATKAGVHTGAYWTVPRDLEIVFRRDSREYVQGFREVLKAAVADRLPDRGAALLMSGGLDSPALAVLGGEVLAERGSSSGLRAHTIVYDRLFADEERHFSALVARHLNLRITHHPADHYGLYRDFARHGGHFPEPTHEPFAALDLDVAAAAAGADRVMLTGWDGDTLLNEPPRPYFRRLRASGSWVELAASLARYAAKERGIVGAAWRTIRPRRAGPQAAAAEMPSWVHPAFAQRMAMRERLAAAASIPPHPLRPHALRSLDLLMRASRFFEPADPGFSRSHIQYRHPFMDLRVVDYCLSLPVYPWCADKRVLRDSMRGALPRAILQRPKTPLAGYPHHVHLHDPGSSWLHEHRLGDAAAAYLNRGKISSLRAEGDEARSWVQLRPLSLDLWLRAVGATSFHHRESIHEFA